MPTDSEIRRALRDNICRCTGYIQILESVDQAGAWIADPDRFKGWEPKVGGIRVSAVLVDGEASVKGELAYADDMVLPGMLHGQIVWSEYPHAKILSVDTSEARRSPGVSRVITSADVPGLNAHGRSTPDQAVFCDEYVRYTGDPIALVLAATKAQAVAAAVLVKVDYEELRGIHTTAEALADGAPGYYRRWRGRSARNFSTTSETSPRPSPQRPTSWRAASRPNARTTPISNHWYAWP